MRGLRSAILVTAILFGTADAWGATDEEASLAAAMVENLAKMASTTTTRWPRATT